MAEDAEDKSRIFYFKSTILNCHELKDDQTRGKQSQCPANMCVLLHHLAINRNIAVRYGHDTYARASHGQHLQRLSLPV